MRRASEAADALADQHDPDDEKEDGHDGGVVVDEPAAKGLERLAILSSSIR
jgi:hypothetical protein